MRRVEKVASIVTGTLVGTFATLGVYTAHGPVLSAPVIVTVSNDVMSAVCGPNTLGCYRNGLPDFIVLSEAGLNDAATLPHEMLHYAHPEWSECEVSNHLFDTTGLSDGYRGEC